jgi:hypothetical protein
VTEPNAYSQGQLFTPHELTGLARTAGLELVVACTEFEEAAPASPEHARRQLVFARGNYS